MPQSTGTEGIIRKAGKFKRVTWESTEKVHGGRDRGRGPREGGSRGASKVNVICARLKHRVPGLVVDLHP